MYQADKSKGETARDDAALNRLLKFQDMDNIADDLSDDELKSLGALVCDEYEIDQRSRSEWVGKAEKAMKMALQAKEAKNYPFKNASNVKFPLITVAALQFNARAYPALVDPAGIVKAAVIGEDPENEKAERARRVSEHMSWQLMSQMSEWEEDTDTLLIQIPIVGCAFRKTFWDSKENRPKSVMVSGLDLVVNQSARSLKTVPRITHVTELYPYEIKEEQRAGRFCECELSPATTSDGDKDAPNEILEQHRWIDLDDDGCDEPYIVTVHKQSSQVLRIQANYEFDKIETKDGRIIRIPKQNYFTKYSFIPDPEGGFYDIGYGHLLENLSETIDTSINQVMDAGHLQNAGGGFVGSGIQLGKGLFRMEPGVYHTVQASGSKLREGIVNMDHPGPSPVLFNMIDLLINAAQDITAVKDIMTGDSGGKVIQPTSMLALIEQGMKVFTAIYRRVRRGLGEEFKLLYDLNAKYLDQQSYLNVLDTEKAVQRDDYNTDGMDIAPQADPRLVTDMQRMAQAQVLMEVGNGNGLYNQIELHKRFLRAANIEDPENVLIEQPEPGPMDQAQLATAEADIQNKQADTQAKLAKAQKDASDSQVNELKAAMEFATPNDQQGRV